jgi:hypothetical protein
MAEADARAVLQKQLEKAKEGDATAAQLILSRIWPARKSRPVNLDLPALESPGDIVTALAAIADAVGTGSITPDEGLAVASILETKRKAIETMNHEKRLRALENRK